MAVGVAAALAVGRPDTLPLLVGGTMAAAIGSVISDIDMGASSAHHEADYITAFMVSVCLAVFFGDMYLKLGVYEAISHRVSASAQLPVALVFIGICAIGKISRHRHFMHSFLCLMLLGACICRMFPRVVSYFAVAFLTHLFLDLWNTKKVYLWWPLKRGYCFKICRSAGRLNRLLFAVGIVSSVTLFMTSTPMAKVKADMETVWRQTVVENVRSLPDRFRTE